VELNKDKRKGNLFIDYNFWIGKGKSYVQLKLSISSPQGFIFEKSNPIK
jgi:hypothetical protein